MIAFAQKVRNRSTSKPALPTRAVIPQANYNNFTNSKMKTITKVSVLVFLFAALTTCSLDAPIPARPEPLRNFELDLSPSDDAAMVVGSSCVGSEGAWFCMSSSFQRCASGLWSAVEACALGTICEPNGLTYDMQSAFGVAPDPSRTTTVIDTASTTSMTSNDAATVSSSTSASETQPEDQTTASATPSLAGGTKTVTETETDGMANTASGHQSIDGSGTAAGPIPTITDITYCSNPGGSKTCTMSAVTSTATSSHGVPKNDTSTGSSHGPGNFSWILAFSAGLLIALGRT